MLPLDTGHVWIGFIKVFLLLLLLDVGMVNDNEN